MSGEFLCAFCPERTPHPSGVPPWRLGVVLRSGSVQPSWPFPGEVQSTGPAAGRRSERQRAVRPRRPRARAVRRAGARRNARTIERHRLGGGVRHQVVGRRGAGRDEPARSSGIKTVVPVRARRSRGSKSRRRTFGDDLVPDEVRAGRSARHGSVPTPTDGDARHRSRSARIKTLRSGLNRSGVVVPRLPVGFTKPLHYRCANPARGVQR